MSLCDGDCFECKYDDCILDVASIPLHDQIEDSGLVDDILSLRVPLVLSFECYPVIPSEYIPYNPKWKSQKEWRKYYRSKIRGNRREYRLYHCRKYYQEHRDELSEYNRIYYQEHKEKIAEYKRRYYQEHKKEYAERSRRYYQEHKKECAERSLRYYYQRKNELKGV